MADAVLTINAGSSGIMFALFDTDLAQIADSAVSGVGVAPHFKAHDAAAKLVTERSWDHGAGITHETLLGPMLDWIEYFLGGATLLAIGHHIVLGGRDFLAPCA